MAEAKKGFILYADLLTVVEKLVLEDRKNKTNYSGELFYHILQYVNDDDPIPINFIIDMSFEPIKLQLKRDLDKWEETRGKRSDAGKKSAESRRLKREQALTNLTSVKSVEQTLTNPTVNDNGNVSVTVNDKVNVIKKTLLDRETEFKNSLQPFLQQYGKQTLNDFYLYWTEKKPNGRKMLFEMRKTFDIKRRLITWSKNDFNNSKNGNSKNNKPTLETLHEQHKGYLSGPSNKPNKD
jgi:hypothetical protein